MAQPKRYLVMADVLASLAGISELDGYHLTAAKVERGLLDPREVPVDQTPWFGAITAGTEDATFQANSLIDQDLRFLVAGAVAIPPNGDQTPDNRALLCAQLMDDIKFALCGTAALSGRNGLAVKTTCTQRWSDEGHAIKDVLVSGGNVIAYVIVRGVIEYEEDRGHS